MMSEPADALIIHTIDLAKNRQDAVVPGLEMATHKHPLPLPATSKRTIRFTSNRITPGANKAPALNNPLLHLCIESRAYI